MDLEFQTIHYDGSTFFEAALPSIPRSTAVYRIFDIHGRLIVLNKTSNLSHRLERFFGPHSERLKDLDLRQITSRIEFIRTFSPFETAYTLYLERRRYFPKSYRRMKTFRYFTLMKINRKQRFPRIYASRQLKAGVDYFGPFATRGQFARMKTALERTFKLRPCPFNIRGNDPRPDCLYFQMHTCSRPCNNDIDRPQYLEDVKRAMAFVQGQDDAIRKPWIEEMTRLAADMKFEEAEAIRRKVERLQRTRQELQSMKEAFSDLQSFNFVIVLPSDASSRVKIVIVRGGAIVGFRNHEITSLHTTLSEDLSSRFAAALPALNREWLYDEFCLVCTFMVKTLQSVQFVRHEGNIEDTVAAIAKRVKRSNKSEAIRAE
jgi:excinuclease ABC subunit C